MNRALVVTTASAVALMPGTRTLNAQSTASPSTVSAAMSMMLPTVFHACYVREGGTIYRIKESGLPGQCFKTDDVQFSWTDGANYHGALAGLLDDDHPQYLRNGPNIPGSSYGSRLSWDPSKAAFRAGFATNIPGDAANAGNYSVGLGYNATAGGARGEGSTAFGRLFVEASGRAATAGGYFSQASGLASVALSGLAAGDMSVALGVFAVARGVLSTAWGGGQASGQASIAGGRAQATGYASTAIGGSFQVGGDAVASGAYSTALGPASVASGQASTALGHGTQASGANSLAGGFASVASGDNSMAIGDSVSTHGTSSIAIGSYASDGGFPGAFVFGDRSTFWLGNNKVVEAITPNEFVVRASVGFRFRTSSDLSTGCELPAGSGVFSCTSSRLTKTDLAPLDGEAVLRKLAALSIQTWSYKTELGVRHAGLTAEDFHAAFGLGSDSTAIGTIDADGISMLALQAVEARTRTLRQANDELRRTHVEIRARLDRLEALVRRACAASRSPCSRRHLL